MKTIYTPHGRKLDAGMLAHQASLDEFRTKSAGSREPAHKWQIFRDVSAIRMQLGLSDRSLSVLNALLSFLPDTTMSDAGDQDLIVFPSNTSLCRRAHNMAEATLRRHLAALVAAGLIVRRDSPNGKRYARKADSGEGEILPANDHANERFSVVYGFDLSILLMRAPEFASAAAELARVQRRLALAHEKIVICRRDIASLIELASEAGIEIMDGGELAEFMQALPGRRGSMSLADCEIMLDKLSAIRANMTTRLEISIKSLENQDISTNMSGNANDSGRHKQNQNYNSTRIEPLLCETQEQNPLDLIEDHQEYPRNKSPKINLGLVLSACPDINEYGNGAVKDWRELIERARLVRSMLGISPQAWQESIDVFGEGDAAILIAAILQKGEAINSPGGYLRALNVKQREGQFKMGPMLMAIMAGGVKARSA